LTVAKITSCHWSPTGHAYETADGACSCRIASPPGLALYGGEIAALEHEQSIRIATALDDQERLDELVDNPPRDYERMLASAAAKLAGEGG
jgi:hypothetical protein